MSGAAGGRLSAQDGRCLIKRHKAGARHVSGIDSCSTSKGDIYIYIYK